VKSLALQAKEDFRSIMNSNIGALIEITITSPDKAVHIFSGRNANISQSIDPGTNQTVISAQNVVAVEIEDLKAVGFEIIRGVSDNSLKPWIASVDGDEKSYKVTEANPDWSLSSMVLWLENLELNNA
jgi:hypothetical protein